MSIKRLLIVGAGSVGREVLDWALDIPESQRDWEVGGFLDSRPDLLDGFNRSHRILGDPTTFELSENDRLVCAIADSRARLEYAQRLQQRGGQFVTLRHPSGWLGGNSRIGTGCILGPGAIIDCDVVLGNHVMLYFHSGVGHDSVLGDGCQLGPAAVVCGCCTLGRGVFVGCNASVLPHVRIGDFAVVGSGSAVRKRVRGGTLVMGVPAKVYHAVNTTSP